MALSEDYLTRLHSIANRRGYQLIHRRFQVHADSLGLMYDHRSKEDGFWLMPLKPMTLVEVVERLDTI